MLTPGTIAALIMVPLGLLLILAAAFFGWRALKSSDGEFWGMGALFSVLAGLPMFILPLIGMSFVGFSADYMHYQPVTGEVQNIAQRQVSSGNGMATRYVVELDGEAYAIDDTRAALLKTGDVVNLVCVKEFDWGSPNNGYACKWAK